MNTAIWFSRHAPSPEQIKEAHEMGFTIAMIPEGMELGARSIQNEDGLAEILKSLQELASSCDAAALFGVFPVPLQGIISSSSDEIHCYAAWNVSRTQENGPPTFSHYKWVKVGCL
jgi:hypothetical protein